MDTLFDFWHTLTRPGDSDLLSRLKWVGIAIGVLLCAGIWIGQQVLANNEAYYPRERFGLALAWSLLALAAVLTSLIGVGWLSGGTVQWVGLSVHLGVILVALLGALLLMPRKSTPRRRRP